MRTAEEIRALVGTLPAGTVPLVLLPVQLQTRFVVRGDVPQLLVRVYPDEVHLDSHDPDLTAAEAEWGRRYWELIWPVARDTAALARAWNALADRFGARRAAWVARRMTPTNLDKRPDTPPTFPDAGPARSETASPPVLARALPDRWVVIGYHNNKRVLLEAGSPIRDALAMSPDSDEPPGPPPRAGDLPVDAGMRWMIDFAEAEQVGMGIRSTLSGGIPRLDILLVFGVRTGLTPDAAATRLEEMLQAHHYTGGLAFLAPGTPTNNTAEAASGFSQRDASGLPVDVAPPRLGTGADGAEVARLVGIKRELFAPVEGATRLEDLAARRLHAALWPVTGGYQLEQMVTGLAPRELDSARRFFIDFVRAQGPLPVLRIGRQPYGLVPAMSLEALVATPAGTGRFVRTLRALRDMWRDSLHRVPRLLPGAEDEEHLVEILRMQPLAAGYRARLAFGVETFVPEMLPGELPPDLRAHASLLRRRLQPLIDQGLAGNERFFDIVPARSSRRVAAALVQRGDQPPGGYLRFLRTATFDDILAERLPEAPGTLLYALLRHSVLLAQAGTAYRIFVRRGVLPDVPYREPVLVDIVGVREPDRTPTLLRVLDLDPALRASIHTATAAQEPEAAALDELRQGLAHLQTMPADALERHLTGCLDLFGYRLDAWITALATRRLNEIRRQSPRGIALGGFGWVENLVPEPRVPVIAPPPGEEAGGTLFAATERGGAIHAPSMGQAAAAAVLRSGYLTDNGDGGARPFAVDLRSERVRLAQFLLDGVRNGQPLDALLGYRLERGLHERGLDRFIPGFRRERLAPVYDAQESLVAAHDSLRAARDRSMYLKAQAAIRHARVQIQAALAAVREHYGWPERASLDFGPGDATSRPPDWGLVTPAVAELERLANGGVADGLELARTFREATLRLDRVAPGVIAAQRAELEAELRALDDAVDALSDALTAEGVYQLVRGNPARASATVDAVAHGEVQPPELEVVQTPRPGTAVTHRLLVLFSAPPPTPPAAGPRGARAAAEPALELWLRQMLGDLRSVIYRAEFVNAAGTVLLRRDNLRLGTLVGSPLDALYLGAAAQPGSPSEIERLLEYSLWRGAPVTIPDDARLRLLVERTPELPAVALGLGEFLEVLRAFREAILPARAVDGRDLAPAGDEVAPGVDAAELAARANAAVEALRRARAALAAPDDVRERLADFVFLGFPDAVPLAPRGGDALAAQAAATLAEADRRLALVDAAGIDRAAASPEDQVRFDQERLRAVFGPAFRALPLVRPANLREISDSFRRSDELQGGDPLQALSWLQGASRVRPGASRLDAALMYAAALERPPALVLKVAQLPFVAGERWIGLPPTAGRALPQGKISVVAHLPRPFQVDAPLAGLMVDEWVDVVPAADITTGVAFNYDGPGARPPQSVLLAVAPPGTTRWDVETLEQTLLETFELARLRALDPQSLGDDVLYQRALPALSVSLNLAGEALSTDFTKLPSA